MKLKIEPNETKHNLSQAAGLHMNTKLGLCTFSHLTSICIMYHYIRIKASSALFLRAQSTLRRRFNTKWPPWSGLCISVLSPCPIDSPPGCPRSVIWQNKIHGSKIKLDLAGLSDEYGGDEVRRGERGGGCRKGQHGGGEGERDRPL